MIGYDSDDSYFSPDDTGGLTNTKTVSNQDAPYEFQITIINPCINITSSGETQNNLYYNSSLSHV